MKSGECPKCKSREVLPDVRILDQIDELWNEELTAELRAKPNALFRKGKTKSTLRAWLCGSCGYVELYSVNPDELLRKHKSKS